MLARQGRIRLIEKHTDTDGMLGTAELDRTGRLTSPSARHGHADPTGMLDALEQHWNDNGMPDRLHTERFRPTVVTAGEGGDRHLHASPRRPSTPRATKRCSTPARPPAC